MNGTTAPELSETFLLELRMSQEIQASEKTGEIFNYWLEIFLVHPFRFLRDRFLRDSLVLIGRYF